MDSLQPRFRTASVKGVGSKLAALVRADDLRYAKASKRLLQNLRGMTGFQRNRHLPGQGTAARHIDYHGQVYEASRHGNVGGIQKPRPVWCAPNSAKVLSSRRAEALGQATPFTTMLGHKQYGIQYLEVGKTDVTSLAWQATLDSCVLG